jgi:hypothetical protein
LISDMSFGTSRAQVLSICNLPVRSAEKRSIFCVSPTEPFQCIVDATEVAC